MLEQHRGTAALFVLLTIVLFRIFFFFMFVTLTVLFLLLGASIVCLYNYLKRAADHLVLWFPDRKNFCDPAQRIFFLVINSVEYVCLFYAGIQSWIFLSRLVLGLKGRDSPTTSSTMAIGSSKGSRFSYFWGWVVTLVTHVISSFSAMTCPL